MMIVVESPGRAEIQMKKPFAGDSGRILEATLKAGGFSFKDIYITSAVQCSPETPLNLTMVQACSNRLMREISQVKPERILTIGGMAFAALQGEKIGSGGVLGVRGRTFRMNLGGHEALVLPTLHPGIILRDSEFYRDLAYDVKKWLETTGPSNLPDVELWVPNSPKDLIQMLRDFRSASRVSCDLETTGFNPMVDEVLSIGLGALDSDNPEKGVSLIIPSALLRRYPKLISELFDFFDQFEGLLGFHNLKFDLRFLQTFFRNHGHNYEPRQITDTMLLNYALDERPIGTYGAHRLKNIARIRYDAEDYAFDFEKYFALSIEDQTRLLPILYKYQGLDCFYTRRLMDDLQKEAEEESPKLWGMVQNLLVPGTVALARLEQVGVLIDQNYLREAITNVTQEISDLQDRLGSLAVELSGDEGFRGLNPLSPTQVVKLLRSLKLITSEQGGDKGTLGGVALKHRDTPAGELVQGILDYRLKGKIKSTYFEGVLTRLDSDGRLRSDFRVHGTRTGRLSSANPNLQNIPVVLGPLVRKAFIADSRVRPKIFIEADYSQLELRILAFYTQDPELLRSYRNGEDIHRLVGARMFNKSPEDVTYFERYLAKQVDFGVVYGRVASTIAEGPEMDFFEQMGGTRWTVQDAQRFLNEFLDSFPKLRGWLNGQKEKLHSHVIETPTGRRVRFPYIDSKSLHHEQNRSINNPIQSLASDLCFRAVTELSLRPPLLEEGMRLYGEPIIQLLLTVHDSILFEVIQGHEVEAARAIKWEMEHIYEKLGLDLNLPLLAELKIGPNWGEMTDYHPEPTTSG